MERIEASSTRTKCSGIRDHNSPQTHSAGSQPTQQGKTGRTSPGIGRTVLGEGSRARITLSDPTTNGQGRMEQAGHWKDQPHRRERPDLLQCLPTPTTPILAHLCQSTHCQLPRFREHGKGARAMFDWQRFAHNREGSGGGVQDQLVVKSDIYSEPFWQDFSRQE